MKIGKKIIGMLAVLAISAVVVTAGILTFYGELNVTANVGQSVVFSGDGETWHNYDEPLIRDINDGEEIYHCTDYTYKAWIWNRACEEAEVEIVDDWVQAPGGPGGFDITHYVIGDTQTIRLVQKEIIWDQSPWEELEEGMDAVLIFNTCGPTFEWTIESEYDLSDYSLIYYENHPDYWEGTPVHILGDLATGYTGSTDAPTMPYIDDENAQRPISDVGEAYDHLYGAKFWLVPTESIINGEVNWDDAASFLFETDLGLYVDCDNMHPIWIPLVYDAFDVTTLQPESVYCWLTCYHTDMNIMPGIYQFNTYIQPPMP